MKLPTVVAFAVFLGACKLVANIDDTKLIPDAAKQPADGPPDASPDAPPVELPIDVGDGADGPLIVSNTAYTDDIRSRLRTPVAIGSTRVEPDSTASFEADDEVLIIQMSGPDAGIHETHRIREVKVDHLVLHTPLGASFDANNRAQVIRIPNYSRVDIPVNATLTAHPWDEVSGTGGVVFFRSSGAVTIAGTLHANALGWVGGTATTIVAAGGLPGVGGSGGAKDACPPLNCQNFVIGGTGTPGRVIGDGALGAPHGTKLNMCHGGPGGKGGIGGFAGEPATVGAPGHGEGGGGPSEGGRQLGMEYFRPILGAGGGAGSSGAGGLGAGGGGGGGGPLTSNGGVSGTFGANGERGGVGGLGGNGGLGGGVVIVYAASISLSGSVTATGSAGTGGTAGGPGGIGGYGGFGSNFNGMTPCHNTQIFGGRGGGGAGGAGGDGGGGGGGGAGGFVVLNAREMSVTMSGTLLAKGGAGTTEGLGGEAGLGGDGFTQGPTGAVGTSGAPGQVGQPGLSFIRHAGTCDGCAGIGDPLVVVTQVDPS